jgi:hypothetical protein
VLARGPILAAQLLLHVLELTRRKSLSSEHQQYCSGSRTAAPGEAVAATASEPELSGTWSSCTTSHWSKGKHIKHSRPPGRRMGSRVDCWTAPPSSGSCSRSCTGMAVMGTNLKHR